MMITEKGGNMKKLEERSFRKALRLGRRRIKVYLENDRKPTRVWSNYTLSRGVPMPAQKLPKVGHFSDPKKER
jgi:hypothetical protein